MNITNQPQGAKPLNLGCYIPLTCRLRLATRENELCACEMRLTSTSHRVAAGIKMEWCALKETGRLVLLFCSETNKNSPLLVCKGGFRGQWVIYRELVH